MTEQDENLAQAKSAAEMFASGDVEGFLATLDPGVEIYSTPDLPNPGTFSGRAGWVEWSSAWFEAWENFEIEIEDYVPVGGSHVVMQAVQRARGAGSGVPVEMRVWYLAQYRAGLATRFHLYASREDALAAAKAGESQPG